MVVSTDFIHCFHCFIEALFQDYGLIPDSVAALGLLKIALGLYICCRCFLVCSRMVVLILAFLDFILKLDHLVVKQGSDYLLALEVNHVAYFKHPLSHGFLELGILCSQSLESVAKNLLRCGPALSLVLLDCAMDFFGEFLDALSPPINAIDSLI